MADERAAKSIWVVISEKIGVLHYVIIFLFATGTVWVNYALTQQSFANEIKNIKDNDTRQDVKIAGQETLSDGQVALIIQKLSSSVVSKDELGFRLKPLVDEQAYQRHLLEQILAQQGAIRPIQPAP